MTRKAKEPTEPPVPVYVVIDAEGTARRVPPLPVQGHADCLCRCGAPFNFRPGRGGYDFGGREHVCVPVPPSPMRLGTRTPQDDAELVARCRLAAAPNPQDSAGPDRAVGLVATPNDEGAPSEPPTRSERKPRLVRSTSNEPAKPTGEPERTADPDVGWLAS